MKFKSLLLLVGFIPALAMAEVAKPAPEKPPAVVARPAVVVTHIHHYYEPQPMMGGWWSGTIHAKPAEPPQGAARPAVGVTHVYHHHYHHGHGMMMLPGMGGMPPGMMLPGMGPLGEVIPEGNYWNGSPLPSGEIVSWDAVTNRAIIIPAPPAPR